MKKNTLKLLQEGKFSEFDNIYQEYWASLYAFAYNTIRNKLVCEEIIQETFLSLWTKKESLQISTSIESYLYAAVKYQVINYIRSEKVKEHYALSYASFYAEFVDNSTEENIRLSDLKSHLENEVSKLPERCQQIFRLSRNDHHPVKTIAGLLNISHKTVENQLTKALKHLRSSLGEFLMIFIIPFFPF